MKVLSQTFTQDDDAVVVVMVAIAAAQNAISSMLVFDI